MTRSFSLTPHEEDLLEEIARIWYGGRARSVSATVGRMILETAKRLGIERQEGRTTGSEQEDAPEPEV